MGITVHLKRLWQALLPMGHRVCFNLTLHSDSRCQTTHFSGAEHLLILKTTCRQAASGLFIMTTSMAKLAVSFFLCVLRSVTEMRSFYKCFYSAAVNTARAGNKVTNFPADISLFATTVASEPFTITCYDVSL